MKKSGLNKLSLILVIGILLMGVFSQTNQLFAQDKGLTTIQSKLPFEQTVEKLRKLVSQNGMMVLSELNQGKVLSMTGLKLNAISLFVGNPNIGNKLFSADPAVGVAVPARVNIYESKDGKTFINYVKPTVQLASFKEPAIQKIAGMLDGKLAKLTGMLSQ